MGDPAAHPLVSTTDEGYKLLRDSIVSQQFPQSFSVHAVEGLLIVDEADVERGVPFHRLLHNDPQDSSTLTVPKVLSRSIVFICFVTAVM